MYIHTYVFIQVFHVASKKIIEWDFSCLMLSIFLGAIPTSANTMAMMGMQVIQLTRTQVEKYSFGEGGSKQFVGALWSIYIYSCWRCHHLRWLAPAGHDHWLYRYPQSSEVISKRSGTIWKAIAKDPHIPSCLSNQGTA